MFFITSGLTDIYPVDTEKNEIINEKEMFRKQLFFSLKLGSVIGMRKT